MDTKIIKASDIELNTGQIEGLPKNPRFIRDKQYENLKKSIQDFPEMLKLRELIVFPIGDKFVVIAGNMRYRAGKEIGLDEFPCKILDTNTTVERLREITIKDNNSFGEWDFDDLANEWEVDELDEWGVDLPFNFSDDVNFDEFFDENTKDIKDPDLMRNWKSIIIKINPENDDKIEEIKSQIKITLEPYNGLVIK